MTRRMAFLAILAAPMGNFLALTPSYAGGAGLRVPLDQWHTLTIEHQGKSITFTAAEIFTALQGEK